MSLSLKWAMKAANLQLSILVSSIALPVMKYTLDVSLQLDVFNADSNMSHALCFVHVFMKVQL